MKILITGGAGFIGSNFIRFTLERDPNHEIRVLDDLSTGRGANIANFPVKFIKGSLADSELVMAAADGVDAIVHLGALGSVPRSVADPVSSHVANLTGTLNVLEAARRAGAYVVFASSSSVYGANRSLPKSEFDWTRPMSPYAVTKLGAEGYVIAYQFAYGLKSLAFRFFNVYGPNQPADHDYAAVIPRFMAAALAGEPLLVHGDGRQSRDFTYVDSVCGALYSAITRQVSSTDPVNLAFGTNTTLLELKAAIQSELGHEVMIEHTNERLGDVRASQSDGLRMRELFPEIQPVPLSVGLGQTLTWFRSISASA
ncbi:NAD-dependent epimerase/dehydratase family protein [Arthrobacter sp. KK5.5]|uniref:NAD-dependent epimerase/dehydratase family protein n=1 Tax=Arthrobacter sp. KK5.5 TaxID=3373084 RepID=UPI003EE4B1F4